MQVTREFPLVDEILGGYRDVIKDDYAGYRNHVTRMLNFCHALNPNLTEQESKKLQIAAAFHDIALWTHNRVDYLVPSYQECQQWLEDNDLGDWQYELQIIIDMHHLVTRYKGPHAELAELFRKADLVDFSMGLVRHGISGDVIKAVKHALPNAGFHRTLMRFTWQQLKRKPFKPMPMMRVRNLYRS